jgi:hypothetical protein
MRGTWPATAHATHSKEVAATPTTPTVDAVGVAALVVVAVPTLTAVPQTRGGTW